MALQSFLFGGDTNETPESIKRKRDIARALLGAQGAPRNVGEGLNALGDGIVSAVLNSRADKAEKTGMESAANDFSPLIGGFGASPTTPGATGSSMPKVDASGNVATPSTGKEWETIGPRLTSDLSKDFQLSPEQAAGVVGQLGQESAGFGSLQEKNPMVPGSRGGFGYAQWTGPRRKAFEAWSQQNGLDPTSYEANYGFLKNELANSPEGAVLDDLRKAPDALTSGRVFTDKFLRPGIPNYDSRDAWTKKALAFAQSPTEVASLDPSAGMTDQSAIQPPPVNPPAPPPTPGYVDPRVTTEGRAPMPVQPPAQVQQPSPAVAQALMAPQKGGRLGMPPQPLPDADFNSRFGSDDTGAIPPQGGALRPFKPGEQRPNPDGSYSTEISTTWQTPDGQWVNVPSLWMGPNGPKQFDPNDEDSILGAMQAFEAANGPTFQRFGSEQDAVGAAKARSAAGGAGSGPQATSQGALPPLPSSTIAPAPNVASVPPVAETAAAPNPQVAQALLQGDRSGVGIGGAAPGAGYFPAPPNAQAQSGPSQQQIMRVLTNPYASDSQKAVANALLQRQMDESDPSTQLDREYKRAQLESLRAKPKKEWQKLSDTTLFNPETAEVKDIAPTGPGGTKTFRFAGNSVEAQSLNGLIDSGQITPDQAQQLGAGKTITGPNGEIIFMTPQGVFGKPANGGAAQPLGATQAPIDLFGDGGAAAPAGSAPQPAQPAQQGMIPLTEPKITADEKKAMTFADRMTTSGAIIDTMGMKGSGKADQITSKVPVIGEYLTSDDYKKLDQAKRDFINAQLRRESGAVIADSEFANAEQQYFPQPNDPPDVIEQKRLLRQRVIEGMQRDAGPTYKAPEIQTDEGWSEIAPGVRVRKVN